MALRTIYAPFNPQIQIKDSSGGLHVPWHAREKITTWNFMGPTSQTTTPFLDLQNQRSTWVTARGAVESAAESYLSNCWLQFRHNRGTGRCYAVEEGTGQHKVNVSPWPPRKSTSTSPVKTSTLSQWIHVQFMDPSSLKQLLQLDKYKLLTETTYLLITC